MLTFSRKPGTAIYELKDEEAGYVREVKLEDVLEKIVMPAIRQADWFITAHRVGVHPDGTPHDKSPAEATALREDG